MSILLKLFEPAPHLPEIQDQAAVDKNYRYWRMRIFYSMFVGYALYYFTRLSYTSAKVVLTDELGFDKAELGLIGTIFAIAYGLSKFASGILSDKSNPRYFMAVGLFVTGVVNIFFGMSSSLITFALCWGLNGWFQGFGWPACARFLTHWYSHTERGGWWSTWNISHNIGAVLTPIIIGFMVQYFGWRSAMYLPGVICILGSFYLVNRLRDTPESLGLPSIEKWRSDYVSTSVRPGHEKEIPSTKEILVKYVLSNKYIWLLAIAYLFVYIVRMGINEWANMFLKEGKGYTPFAANLVASIFEVGGAMGSLAAGWASDKIFGAKRGPVNTLFAVGMFVTITVFWYYSPENPWIHLGWLFMMGFMIFGPQMLIGVHAAELSHKEAAATVTGFIGLFAYAGAALAGYPLGKITDDLGWNAYLITLISCSIASSLLLIPLWNAVEYNQRKVAKPKTV